MRTSRRARSEADACRLEDRSALAASALASLALILLLGVVSALLSLAHLA